MIQPGQVWLVKAGPGDPGLLTRRAEKLIRAASVVTLAAPDATLAITWAKLQ